MLTDTGKTSDDPQGMNQMAMSCRSAGGCVDSLACTTCGAIVRDSICLCVGVFTCPRCGSVHGSTLPELPPIEIVEPADTQPPNMGFRANRLFPGDARALVEWLIVLAPEVGGDLTEIRCFISAIAEHLRVDIDVPDLWDLEEKLERGAK